MKKETITILSLSMILFFASCAPTNKTLYSWGNYQQKSYGYVKNTNDATLDDLLKSYEDVINKQRGTRKTIPPGVCADYGYHLVQKGKKAEGIAMMKKEIALYPESAVFVEQIIKKLEE